jgi:hypothetical protein
MKLHVQRRSRGGIGPKKGDYTRCSSCIVGGIEIDPRSNVLDGRPRFRCTRCGATFTNGKSGEPYFSTLKGWALPPGWGIDYSHAETYVRERDGAVVRRSYGEEQWNCETEASRYYIPRPRFATPLEAMLAAEPAKEST